MFGGSDFNELNLSNFNTHNVKSMEFMFSRCEYLTSLNISNFDTSKVTNIRYMFSGCKTLLSIDLSSFNTSRIKSIDYLFNNNYYLHRIDISGFTENLNYKYAFENIRQSGIIKVNEKIILKIIKYIPSTWIIITE